MPIRSAPWAANVGLPVSRPRSAKRYGSGAAEAIEIVAHGDHKTSRVVGRCIDELTLPEGTTVGAIARNAQVIFPQRDTVIESEDHIVVFLADKGKIAEVEKLFQVAVTYI